MNSPMIVFGVVRGLHDLFTAVWIGGMIVLAVAVMPSARQVLGDGPQLRQLLGIVQKRLSNMVYASMVGLIVTGVLEARQNPHTAALAVKHLLVIAMVAVALYRSLVLAKREARTAWRLNATLLKANLLLGVVVVLLSGIIGALGAR